MVTGVTSPFARPAAGTFRLSWSLALAGQLRAGLSLSVLGQIALPAPLGRLLVFGRSQTGAGARASLAAVLVPAGTLAGLRLAPFGPGTPEGTLQPPPDVAASFPTRQTAGAVVLLDDTGRDRFVAGPGLVLNHLVIACGTWPLLLPLFAPQAPGRLVADIESLCEDLDAFCAITTATVNGIYRRAGVPAPAKMLTIRPTAASVDTALAGVRWLGRSARSAADLARRLPKVTPDMLPGRERSLTAVPSSAEMPTVEGGFSEVGGQDAARRELEAVCLALRDPAAYARWGARPPRGALLYGPPGTGKTLLARCLAQEAGARFLHVRAADVTSKWYGEAERNLQRMFDRARREAPAVLFFDEIDALARTRDDAHEATHRIISTLLENMDGPEESRGIVVLAATNRPEAIDPALLRPGRFDRLVEVPLPDAAGRRAIFQVHCRRAGQQAGRALFAPLDGAAWKRLLDATDGFSGADIAEVVRRALEEKVRSGATGGTVGVDDLLAQAMTVPRPW